MKETEKQMHSEQLKEISWYEMKEISLEAKIKELTSEKEKVEWSNEKRKTKLHELKAFYIKIEAELMQERQKAQDNLHDFSW